MINLYLKEDDNNILRFPIIPHDIEWECPADIGIEKVNDLGSIGIFNGTELKTTEISSYFPNRYYPFCTYRDILKPFEYIRMLEKWKNNGTKLRYIATDTYTNLAVNITGLTYSRQMGTGDVYFTLSLIEHREIKLNKTSNNIKYNENSSNRPVENNPSANKKTHKVVKGDSLWAIAQKYYGDGSKYPQIKEKNKAKYPSLSKNNIIYVGWELEI